jgi:hypothetical protein
MKRKSPRKEIGTKQGVSKIKREGKQDKAKTSWWIRDKQERKDFGGDHHLASFLINEIVGWGSRLCGGGRHSYLSKV